MSSLCAVESLLFQSIDIHSPFPQDLRGAVVAIGNFDGVHLGHQAVLAKALEIGAAQNRKVLALTFEPHPRAFFKPQPPLFRLTPPEEKLLLFEAFGLDGAIIEAFNSNLAQMSAAAFIAELLGQKCGAAHIVAGHDFHFGKGREGSPATLPALALQNKMGVTLVEAETGDGTTAISSSAIRASLHGGDINTANKDLGYRWCVGGKVQNGDKRGRTLGFPTANVALGEGFGLKHGVYAARVFVKGAWYGAAVHFGTRVQFGGGAPLLEAYILDFKGDLYGAALHVEFIRFLRGEKKFADVAALVAQMKQDVDAARQAISATLRAPQTLLQSRIEQLKGACEGASNVRKLVP